MSIISVNNITKKFVIENKVNWFKKSKKELNAIKDLSFNILKGERVGFIGPNGAGKSTTIKMLTGLLLPDEGSISVLGFEPIKRQAPFLKKIGVLFGNTSSLWTDLTVLKNFELLKVIYEIDNKKFELKLKELVLAFKIEDLLKRTVKTLSLGQRMKCEIVACFLHSPEVIFLDEPSIGLDLNSKNTIRNFILNYSELNNITVILTSHDIFDIEEICNRLIIIDEGKIVLDDSINNIKNKYITKKCIKITSSEKNIKWNHHHTKVISIKPYESLIEVNTDEISLKDVIIKIFDSTAILDISIISQSLESIIKNIYSKQND